jgi:hypothetical protein
MGAMPRPYNFSPGPAALPEPVLRQAASEMLDWNGSGLSVMEVSHRGKEFVALQASIETDLRETARHSPNYKVLFLQGGAIGQNAIVPMNLLRGRTRADYVDTGAWATRSIAEAKHYCEVNVAASGAASGYTAIPKQIEWRLDPGRPTCTSAPTRRSAASSTTGCRRPARCRWSPTCPRTSCRGRSTSPATADLRRRAEEHRPGRPHLRHRPRGPARRRLPITPERSTTRSRRPPTR